MTLYTAQKSAVRGRFAPSPTGLLHLGNAWSFLCAWLGARSLGGEMVLRIEDIDPQRSKPEYEAALQEDLHWLGLDWDYGPGAQDAISSCLPEAPALASFRQSENMQSYSAGIEFLQRRGLVYPCFCTRKELRCMAGAPQAGDASAGESVYAGKCSTLTEAEADTLLRAGHKCSLRMRFEEYAGRYLALEDLCLKHPAISMAEAGGDFPLRRSDGVYAYQLTVVLDDIRMGITQVVRGADILTSTPRQLFLYDCFDASPPAYAHVPLMLDHEGERLAKRHASLSLRFLRESGVRPEIALGYLACWGGLRASFEPVRARDLLEGFSFARIKQTVDFLPPNIDSVLLDASK